MVWTKAFANTAMAVVLAGGLLMFGGAVMTARADDDLGGCRRNVDKWEDRLDRDIHRHGFDSRQANHDRHELNEAREDCRRHFGDRWRDNDDRHDHDRDYDHYR
jgi:hypothetical protein